MDSKEFVRIRHYLGKTQAQLARMLGVSPKAVQSFEQGWRNIPPHAERQLLFILYLKRQPEETGKQPCWEAMECGDEQRLHCTAWELRAGNLCWFTNGTVCAGGAQPTWHQKMRLCRQCKVFASLVPPVA